MDWSLSLFFSSFFTAFRSSHRTRFRRLFFSQSRPSSHLVHTLSLPLPSPKSQQCIFNITLIKSSTFRRIHKTLPHALELLDISSTTKEFLPSIGLRITFPDALSPFISVCVVERRYPYLLYALTVSGVAYVLKLRNISSYVNASNSAFPPDEVLEFDIRACSNQHGPITVVAATAGCFVAGFSDGSVSCFQLGSLLDQNAPGINWSFLTLVFVSMSWLMLTLLTRVSLALLWLIRFCSWAAGWFGDGSFVGFYVEVYLLSFYNVNLMGLCIICCLNLVW